jgi:hypothetical protein
MRLSKERLEGIIDDIIAGLALGAIGAVVAYLYSVISGAPSWWPGMSWPPWLAGGAFAMAFASLAATWTRRRMRGASTLEIRSAASPIVTEQSSQPTSSRERAFINVPGEHVPHDLIDIPWLCEELRDLGFSEQEIYQNVQQCYANLGTHGLAYKDQARAFFNDVETRRIFERAYRTDLKRRVRRLDPNGYSHWGAQYFNAPQDQKQDALAALKKGLRSFSWKEGLTDILLQGDNLFSWLHLFGDRQIVNKEMRDHAEQWRLQLKEFARSFNANPQGFEYIDTEPTPPDLPPSPPEFSPEVSAFLGSLWGKLSRLRETIMRLPS